MNKVSLAVSQGLKLYEEQGCTRKKITSVWLCEKMPEGLPIIFFHKLTGLF